MHRALLVLLVLAATLLVGPHPTVLAQPISAAPLAAYKATATISHSTPTQNTRVTVTGKLLKDGKPVVGAKMTASWGYKSTTSVCTATTNKNGIAACTRDISRATIGFKVGVTLRFTDTGGKALGQANTAFTPRKK